MENMFEKVKQKHIGEKEEIGLSCIDHPRELIIAFCDTCQKAVCFDCTRESHKDHSCFKMDHKAVDAKKNIPKICTLIQSKKLPELMNSLQRIKTSKTNVSKTDDVIEKIHKRANELMAIIMEERDLLIEQCQKSAKSQEQYFQIEETLTRRYIELYKTSLQEAPEVSESKNNIELVLFESKLNSQVRDFKPKPILSSVTPVFKPGKTDKSILKNMLGVVSCDSNFENMNAVSGELIGIQPKLVSSIRYSCTNISVICFQGNDFAWIHPAESSVGAIIDIKGAEHKKFEFGVELSDMTVAEKNVILATDTRNMRILKITSNGVLKEIINTAPLQPHGICSCKNGDLLVTQMFRADPKASDSKRLIQRLGKGYIKKLTIQFTESFFNKKHILTHPRRVDENGNGDIVVVDLLGETSGRLCVFDFVGKLRFTYEGSPRRTKFLPFDICCDPELRIFVSDYYNHEINVLSCDGEYIQEILTNQEGLLNPIAVTLDHKNKLWIGGKGGKILVYRY